MLSLVDRLRRVQYRGALDREDRDTMVEAADRIEALEKERAELRELILQVVDYGGAWTLAGIDSWRNRAESYLSASTPDTAAYLDSVEEVYKRPTHIEAEASDVLVICRCGCQRSKWRWYPCKRHIAAMVADFAEGD